MRKLVIFASLALAFVSVACEKENNKEQPAPIDPNTVVFTASLPTKTTIDANDQVVSWASGDEVKFVWAGGATTAAASSSGSSTTFTVEVAEGITELYAVYPASAGGSYDEGNVHVHFNGSRTDGSFAANDICVAKAVKNGDTWSTTLAFKNVACLLKVGVTDSEVTKIQVMGGKDTGTAQAISGLLPVNINGSGVLTTGTATDTGVTVSVTVSGTGNYYIPVLPGVTLSDGFRVGLFKGDNQGTPFFYNGSYTTASGTIIKLSDIESHAGQFYVTPSGAGSRAGQSWTNAMGTAEFKAFVTNQDNHFLLKGATFHFSADEFSFGDDYLVLNYPDHGNVAFTLEGTVTPTDTTTFLGRTALEGTTAGVLWPQQNSYITVKNVKFTGTNGASNASVIRINNSAKEVNLDHCYFRNNSTSGNGGAISLFNSATLNITNCSFSNGTCAGGIVHVNNASAVVNISDSEAKGFTKNAIYVQNCNTFTATRVTFKDNNDAGEYGAAAYVTGSGVVSFNDCDFIRNHSTVQGGAICVNGTSVTTTFTDCDFIDNWCDAKGGAVMIESGNANTTFTGGKFQGNHADGAHNTNAAGAAIYATGSGVKVSCTDVLFKENYNYIGTNTYSGGILRIQQEGGEGYFNGCVFDGNWTNRENSNNSPCAAIVNCRVGDVKYYFNACEFKENTSGVSNDAGRYGGLRGTVFATLAGSTFAFNNCSFHDNYGGRNSDDISWIGMDNTSSTLILANTTIVGDNYRAPETGAGRKNNWGVIKFQNTGNYYLLNTILCSLDPVGNSFWVNGDIMVDGTTKISAGGPKLPVYCWYSKISKEGDDRTNWTEDTGSGHDYYATSASFGGWNAPMIWNGTLTGTNSNMLAATADVNTQIQDADADFYAWLNSIGALGKDIKGKDRGATSWPGCYQN
jgi:predicted outer membrane repeat protein